MSFEAEELSTLLKADVEDSSSFEPAKFTSTIKSFKQKLLSFKEETTSVLSSMHVGVGPNNHRVMGINQIKQL